MTNRIADVFDGSFFIGENLLLAGAEEQRTRGVHIDESVESPIQSNRPASSQSLRHRQQMAPIAVRLNTPVRSSICSHALIKSDAAGTFSRSTHFRHLIGAVRTRKCAVDYYTTADRRSERDVAYGGAT